MSAASRIASRSHDWRADRAAASPWASSLTGCAVPVDAGTLVIGEIRREAVDD
jgi:hypothetical protein